MAIDIKQGYVLVVGSQEYPIKKVNTWSDPDTPTAAMRMICKTVATLKAPPAASGAGQRGVPVAVPGVSFSISPVDPASQQTVQTMIRQGTNSPANLKECYVDGGDTFYQLVLEEFVR